MKPIMLGLLLAAAALEVTGDAVIRKSLFHHAGLARCLLFVGGVGLLTAYGVFLNLAPLEFAQVAGLYLALLFVIWQVVAWLAFGAVPTLPILLGGSLIVAGGLIVSLWKVQ